MNTSFEVPLIVYINSKMLVFSNNLRFYSSPFIFTYIVVYVSTKFTGRNVQINIGAHSSLYLNCYVIVMLMIKVIVNFFVLFLQIVKQPLKMLCSCWIHLDLLDF